MLDSIRQAIGGAVVKLGSAIVTVGKWVKKVGRRIRLRRMAIFTHAPETPEQRQRLRELRKRGK